MPPEKSVITTNDLPVDKTHFSHFQSGAATDQALAPALAGLVGITLLGSLAGAIASGCGKSSDQSGDSGPTFRTGQAASIAIGQTSLTAGQANQGGSAGASTLNLTYGPVAVWDGKLFVSDFVNHRVLGFDAIPSASGASANFVLGQTDFTTTTSGTSAVKFNRPQGVVVHEGKLLIGDSLNHRILIYETIPSSGSDSASAAVGATNLTSAATGCSASELNSPEEFRVIGGKLVVADRGNHRVLIWNSIPSVSGQPADIVLGQPDFTTCTDPSASATASKLRGPSGIASDGTKLLVADQAWNRILVWNSFPTSSGQAADHVIGQQDFTGIAVNIGAAQPTAYSLYEPWGMTVDSVGKLYVADLSNHRVLIWNSIPTVIGESATVVLGQADFTSASNAADPATTASGMSAPASVSLRGDQLFVSDTGNSRVLVFDGE
jgi:hypothetical protein